MANVSVAVEIETRTGHDLSIAFQGVADDQSANVGTLLGSFIFRMLTGISLRVTRIGDIICPRSENELRGAWSTFAPSKLWPRKRGRPERSRSHSGARRGRPGKKRSAWDCRSIPARSLTLHSSKLRPRYYEGGAFSIARFAAAAHGRNWPILLQKSFAFSVNGDFVALMGFAKEAVDDGAAQSRPRAIFLFIPS